MTDSTSGDAKVAALRSDIQETRAQLGETVEALAAKADVKARASDALADAKVRAAEAVSEAKDKTRAKARHVAESGKGLATELRTEPAVPARRAVSRVRTSVRERPRQWVVAAAAFVAFAALIARKRRAAAAKRVTPQSLRDDWRRQWKHDS
jgi:hypothetical protein